jgi:hypothetical protein
MTRTTVHFFAISIFSQHFPRRFGPYLSKNLLLGSLELFASGFNVKPKDFETQRISSSIASHLTEEVEFLLPGHHQWKSVFLK